MQRMFLFLVTALNEALLVAVRPGVATGYGVHSTGLNMQIKLSNNLSRVQGTYE